MRELVEKHIGSAHHVEQGEQHMYHCPVCNHKNPRLSVNYSKDVFKCWVCGFSGGSLIHLLYTLNANPADIERAKGYLGTKKLYTSRDTKISELERYVHEQINKKENTKRFVQRPTSWQPMATMEKGFFTVQAYKYLKSRKLSKYEIELYDIQFNEEDLCISIPSYDRDGNLNFYLDHYFDTKFYRIPKGLNKMQIIFNEYHIDFHQPVNITEGFYDATNIGHNTIPLLGTFLQRPLIQKFIEFNTPYVNIFLDGDAYKQAKGIARYLDYYDVKTNIIKIPKEEDGNSLEKQNIISYLDVDLSNSFKDKIEMLIGD